MAVSAHFQRHSKSTLKGNLPDHNCVCQHIHTFHYLLTGSVSLSSARQLNTVSFLFFFLMPSHIIGLPEPTELTAADSDRGRPPSVNMEMEFPCSPLERKSPPGQG